MRTKKKDQEPWDVPRQPWNEIAPRLWMGGHEYIGPDGEWTPAVAGSEFDAVYSLHSREGHGPAAGVEHHVLEVPDDPLTARQIIAVRDFAFSAAQCWLAGARVLVRCRAGMNRSGLVVAQVMVHGGWPVAEAIDLIRARRSPSALNNEVFVDYLTTGLDLSAELSALGSE